MPPISNFEDDTVGLVYLARGADSEAISKIAAFARSYKLFTPGIGHKVFVVFKGFANAGQLEDGRTALRGIVYEPIFVEDKGFDLGAYFVASLRVESRRIVFCNTASEICGQDWLLKLAVNLALPGVGLVGCTGSFEAPSQLGMGDIVFPNPHVRSNAFMIDRLRFLELCPSSLFAEKQDVHLFEHGPQGITRRVAESGLASLVVGRDGRGYSPLWWPKSRTFRQGMQDNLLVSDNQTRRFQLASITEKQFLYRLAWGDGTIFNSSDPTPPRRDQSSIKARDQLERDMI